MVVFSIIFSFFYRSFFPIKIYIIKSEFDLKRLSIVTHQENLASQRVAQKAGFRMYRQFKGSDRYTRKMRDYIEFRYERGDFYE